MGKIKSLIAVVAATSAVLVVASAGPVGSQQPPGRQTITLFDPRTTEFEHFIDRGKENISSGDTILLVEKLRDPDTCDNVGKLVGRIQIIKKIGRQDALFTGDFTVSLTGGRITAAAAARFTEFESGTPVFAVTGGTQTYKDASGEVSFAENTTLCGVRGDLFTIDVGPTP